MLRKLFRLPARLALAKALVVREISARYKGSVGGVAWYFVQNLITLVLFSFVFGSLFKSRWSDAGMTDAHFVPVLFLGLILFNIFSECLGRAPKEILYNPTYATKVVFPLEILPLVSLGAAAFNGAVALGLLVLLCPLLGISLSWSGLWLPVIVLPFFLLILGLQWFLSSVGTFLRDIHQAVGQVTTALMFLSPVFYPKSIFPEQYRFLLQFNPLSFPVEQARRVVFLDSAPDFAGLAAYSAAAVLVALGGFTWFQKTRKGFADVL